MQLGSKENENERFKHYLEKTFKKTASLIANSCKAVCTFSFCMNGSEMEGTFGLLTPWLLLTACCLLSEGVYSSQLWSWCSRNRLPVWKERRHRFSGTCRCDTSQSHIIIIINVNEQWLLSCSWWMTCWTSPQEPIIWGNLQLQILN